MRRFKKSEWKKLKIIHEPTEIVGMVRQDENGNLYEWKMAGKAVYATLYNPKL